MLTIERRLVILSIALVVTAGCSRTVEPDAYGNVEATEVVVGAEASGRLISFDVTEGQMLTAGASVGEIDPVPLTLERDQLTAQRAAALSRVNEVQQQVQALEAQRASAEAQRAAATAQRAALVTQQEIAKRAFDRTNRLAAQQAATAQQVDQTERDYRVLSDQIQAQDQQINAQERQIAAHAGQVQAAKAQQQTQQHQVAAIDAQLAQLTERIRKTGINSPVPGTVTTTYAKSGEVVQIGQPLFRIADLTAVDVRAYVTEPQLAGIRLGQDAQVSIDVGGGQRQAMPGQVQWISSQAEFTPTPIQTRDERAALVYAIKIRVKNDGARLKIGMPVDVALGSSSSAPPTPPVKP
jgi:HlyD family secretion protein